MNSRTDFRKSQRRKNYGSNGILNFFSANSSRPRLFLEVFVRKNFGRNYFNMGSVLSVAWRVALFPVLVYYLPKLWKYLFTRGAKRTYNDDFWRYYFERRNPTYTHPYWESIGEFWQIYGGWYVLLVAFLVFAIIRWIETMRHNGNSDNVSNYMGDIHPFFFKLNFLGRPTEKNISTIYEPLMFFVVGLFFNAIGQNVGWLIIISSVFYSLGNYADFKYAEGVLTDAEDTMKKNKAVHQFFEGKGNNASQNPSSGNGWDNYTEPTEGDDQPTFVT